MPANPSRSKCCSSLRPSFSTSRFTGRLRRQIETRGCSPACLSEALICFFGWELVWVGDRSVSYDLGHFDLFTESREIRYIVVRISCDRFYCAPNRIDEHERSQENSINNLG